MRRIFSGSRSSSASSSPKMLIKEEFSSETTSSRPLSSTSSGFGSSDHLSVSPELVPVLALLSAQAHRRYTEGVFLLLNDLRSDGTPGDRTWSEVFGVLLGSQLALWDANEIAGASSTSSKLDSQFEHSAGKLQYINLTDATVRLLDSSHSLVTESGKKLDNVLVISTTIKNRYFLQFGNRDILDRWVAAIRLSLFENTSLQEAYTGAFLSSRGSRLGDIKLILADTKHNYEHWMSVRFGTGMPWKRCFAVISQTKSKKQPLGQINFYESDKKLKKANIMATVTKAKALYAVYPSSNQLIDSSTLVKIEGSIVFGKKEEPQESNIFIMLEKHHAVPSYDTVIRFLIPAMNAFELYGRPNKLSSDKQDLSSLLFGLPILPRVYYLDVEDVISLASSQTCIQWGHHDWRDQIRMVLQRKIQQGYKGSGNSDDISSLLASPLIGTSDLFDGASQLRSPRLDRKAGKHSNSLPTSPYNRTSPKKNSRTVANNESQRRSSMQDAASIAEEMDVSPILSSYPDNRFKPKDPSNSYNGLEGIAYNATGAVVGSKTKMSIEQNSPANKTPLNSENQGKNTHRKDKVKSNASDLNSLYDKYSLESGMMHEGNKIERQVLDVVGSQDSFVSWDERPFTTSKKENLVSTPDPVEEFKALSKRLSELDVNSLNISSNSTFFMDQPSQKVNPEIAGIIIGGEDALKQDFDDTNVFDLDYIQEKEMLATTSAYNINESTVVKQAHPSGDAVAKRTPYPHSPELEKQQLSVNYDEKAVRSRATNADLDNRNRQTGRQNDITEGTQMNQGPPQLPKIPYMGTNGMPTAAHGSRADKMASRSQGQHQPHNAGQADGIQNSGMAMHGNLSNRRAQGYDNGVDNHRVIMNGNGQQHNRTIRGDKTMSPQQMQSQNPPYQGHAFTQNNVIDSNGKSSYQSGFQHNTGPPRQQYVNQMPRGPGPVPNGWTRPTGPQQGMPRGMPGGMPGGVPGGMPGGMQAGMPGGMPRSMPGGMPRTMPGGMPGGMPRSMPGGMPRTMPGGMPGGIPRGQPRKRVPPGVQPNIQNVQGGFSQFMPSSQSQGNPYSN